MSSYTHKPLPKHYSTSRALRNEAERQRRDKLNHYVSELATLVPFISNAKKRVDKTSILRLAASYIRLHKVLNKSDQKFSNLPVSVNGGSALRDLFNSIGGFLLVMTTSGKIVYVSEAIEDSFGYSQNDVLGQCFYSLIHHEDAKLLQQQLQPKDSPRRSFYCRLIEKNVSRNDKSRYQIIHVMGHMKEYSPEAESNDEVLTKEATALLCRRRRDRRKSSLSTKLSSDNESEDSISEDDERPFESPSPADNQILVAFVKVVRDRLVTELTWVESMRDEYITRHRLDGSIAYADHRISFVTGLMPEEVLGKSAFDYMHPNDICWSLLAQKQMLGNNQGQGLVTYRLECRDGSFVILRSRGFLEVNKDSGKVDTFICINTVLTVKAAEEEVTNQRKSLLPLLKSTEETNSTMEAIGNGLPPEIKSLLKTRGNVLQNFFSLIGRLLMESRAENFDTSKLMFEEDSEEVQTIPEVPPPSIETLETRSHNGVRSKRRSCNQSNGFSKLRRRSANITGSNGVKSFSPLQTNPEAEDAFSRQSVSRVSPPSLMSNGHSSSPSIPQIPLIPNGHHSPTTPQIPFIPNGHHSPSTPQIPLIPNGHHPPSIPQTSWNSSAQPPSVQQHSWIPNSISPVSPPWSSQPTPHPETYFSPNVQPSYSQIENWGYPNGVPSYPSSANDSNDSHNDLFAPYDLPSLSFEDKASSRSSLTSGNFLSGIEDIQTLVSHSSNVSFQRK